MARVPVDDCPAGPALDAAVARVLWSSFPSLIIDIKRRIVASSEKSLKRGWYGFDDTRRDGLIEFSLELKGYSEKIKPAWELFRELDKHGIVMVSNGDGDSRDCDFIPFDPDKFDNAHISADDWPEAITRAFLKANGVEEIEVSEP